MKIWVDTEFSEFMNPELISIGLVAENGAEFYVEINDTTKQRSIFVVDHVNPLLDLAIHGMPKHEASLRLWVWLSELEGSQHEHELMIDYITDWELIVDLIGDDTLPVNISPKPVDLFGLLDTLILIENAKKPGLNFMWYRSIIKLEYQKAYLEHFFVSKVKQHHALEDARAMKRAWNAALTKMAE